VDGGDILKKCVVICPIGLSPGVVTEVLYSLGEVEGITDVGVIATKDREVQACVELIKAGIEVEIPKLVGRKVYVHTHTMNVPDVDSTENAVEFIEVMAKVIREEIEVHKASKILFNIAGSRKVESALMLMLASVWRVDGVYHVIHKDVKSYNIEVEKIRKEINDILDADNPIEYYLRHRDKFYPILFPDPHDYNVFEVPFIPFSKMEINALKEILRGGSITDSLFGDYELKLYRRMGLIAVAGDKIIPTDLGKVFLNVLDVI